MNAVFNATLPVFALIFLGYVCARTRLLGENAVGVLNKFVVYLALPAVLFHGMTKTPVGELVNVHFAAAFGGGMMLTFAVSFLLDRRARGRLGDAAIEGLASAYPNTAFMGIPLCLIAFGLGSLPATVIATFLVVCVLMATAIVLLELDQQESQSLSATLGKVGIGLVKNPLISAPLVGILCALLKIPLPASLDGFVTLLGNSATPCALVTIGLFTTLGSVVTVSLLLTWMSSRQGDNRMSLYTRLGQAECVLMYRFVRTCPCWT